MLPRRFRFLCVVIMGLIGLIIVSIIFFADLSLKKTNTTIAAKIIDQCQMLDPDLKKQCFSSKILFEVNQDPAQTDRIFTNLWQAAITGKIKDDPRLFSDPAHEAGMIIASKNIDLTRAFDFCGTTFKQGCMHGVIMEYVDRNYPHDVPLEALKKICTVFDDALCQNNCIHGAGHELAAKVKKNLAAVLTLCKAFKIQNQRACESGVLMEFSKGTAGSGSHSHAPVGKISLPCKELGREYQEICYAAESSYGQYNPSQKTFLESYKFCLAITQQYQFNCMLAVSERAIIATAENAERVQAFCKGLPQGQAITCLDSLVYISKTHLENKGLTHELEQYRAVVEF